MGQQDFAGIRNEDRVYIDKTEILKNSFNAYDPPWLQYHTQDAKTAGVVFRTCNLPYPTNARTRNRSEVGTS